MKFLKISILALFTLLPFLLMAQTNVTMMTYNVLNYPADSNSDPTNTLYGDIARAGYFRIIVEDAGADIIIIQELKSSTGADMLVTELNNNGTLGKTYARANIFNTYSGLGNMLIYNANLFNLVSETDVPRVNTSGGSIAARANTHYVLTHPVNPTCTAQEMELNIFSGHLKASSGASNEGRRNAGVQDLIDYIDNNLNATDNIVFGGDMNFYGDYESGYINLTTNATVPLTDPLGGWTRNITADAAKYTQSTRNSNTLGNGGATGGMDDRFDFLFHNNNVQTGAERATYIPNTYSTWGNAGVPTNANASNSTYIFKNEIGLMSDHFPVKMEMELDAPVSLCGSTCPVVIHYGNPISSGVYNASVQITSDATISSTQNVSFFAGTCIDLLPGFETVLGADFCADIQSCFTGSNPTNQLNKEDDKQ